MTGNYDQHGGCGTTAAALACGGSSDLRKTNLWDGSCWSAGNDMNQDHFYGVAMGTQSSCVGCGAGTPAKGAETFDGTSWTNITDMSSVRQRAGGCGTSDSDAYLIGGGDYSSNNRATYWNGVAWSEKNTLNQARLYVYGGTATNCNMSNALIFGGSAAGPAPLSHCESYTNL